MSDGGHPSPRPQSRTSRLWLLVIGLVVLVAVVYGAMLATRSHRPATQAAGDPTAIHSLPTEPARSDAGGPPSASKLVMLDKPGPVLANPFEGPDGKRTQISAFKGKVVVLNVWATWCGPCVKEMPTLAALQTSYAGKPLVVVPVSTDKDEALPKAKAFIARYPALAFHHAPSAWMFAPAVNVQGLPTTIIFDKAGRERARVSGDRNWSDAQTRALIDGLISEAG